MAMFMASFAALTHIGLVHYFCYNCFCACFFLWLGFVLTFRDCDPKALVLSVLIGFVVSFTTTLYTMNFVVFEAKLTIFLFSCCVYMIYIVVDIYLLFTMFNIIGPSLDDNITIEEKVISSVL